MEEGNICLQIWRAYASEVLSSKIVPLEFQLLQIRSDQISRSVVSDSWRPHVLSMEFSRQEYWSRLPFPPPGDLPDPGIELTSPEAPALQADVFFFSFNG